MPLGRSLLSSVVLGGLLLTGCSTYAIYRHPVTGQTVECEQMFYGEWHKFADCKSEVESKGYERTGTRKGDNSGRQSAREPLTVK